MVLVLTVAFSNDTLWYTNLTCRCVHSSAFLKTIHLQSFLLNLAKPLQLPDALSNWQHLYTVPDVVFWSGACPCPWGTFPLGNAEHALTRGTATSLHLPWSSKEWCRGDTFSLGLTSRERSVLSWDRKLWRGLVIQGTDLSLGPAGCKPLPALGGWPSQLQEVGASQVAAPPLLLPLWDGGPEHGTAGGESLCSAVAALTSIPAEQWGIYPTSGWSALSLFCRGRAS